MPIIAADATATCRLAWVPDVLLALILGKLELEDVPNARGVCAHMRQIPLDSFLRDILEGSLSKQHRLALLVEKFCRDPYHAQGVDTEFSSGWPLHVLPVLAQTISLEIKFARGATPLRIAVDCKNVPIVEALIGLGADVNTQDWYGRTPLWAAAAEAYQVLFPTRQAIAAQIANVLIAAGADLDTPCRFDGSTPLLCAVYNRNDGAAYALIEAGANVNTPDFDPDGEPGHSRPPRTPLFYAFKREHVIEGGAELVDAHIEAGAGVDPPEAQGPPEPEDDMAF